MKKFILIYSVLILPWASPAQEGSALIDLVINQLHLNRSECLQDFLMDQPLSESEALVVIPEITEQEGEAAYALRGHVLLVEPQSGRILARNAEPPAWYSDAFYLYRIEVLDNPVVFGEDRQSYGLSMSYAVGSVPDPYETSLLSVWVREGKKLVEVLSEYPIYISRGETNANNSGEFEVHRRTLIPLPVLEKKWPALQVVDSLLRYDYDWDVSPEKHILEKSVIVDTLHIQTSTLKYHWKQ